MSAYNRHTIGWVDYIEITEDGFYPIQSSAVSSQVYMISSPFPDLEYLLIENRQPLKWDSDWPASGIVIYHVDEFMVGQTKRGYPGHPNFPADHYMLAVLQADGKYDIEKGINNGDATDFWTEGMSLGPGDSNGANNITWPNTDAYSSGTRERTGLTIIITTPSRFIMTFEVRGLGSANRSIAANSTTRSQDRDPNTTGWTLRWIFSMLVGSATLVGLLILIL
jgi:hypothetical protein